MDRYLTAAHSVVERCRIIATYSEETGRITRTFLSPPMRAVHSYLKQSMEAAGLTVRLDNAGNLRAISGDGPRLLIGSHLDTVPGAGAYDGILGVTMGLALVELLAGKRLAFAIELIGFSEEEGVRFGVPFIGSRALIGDADSLLTLKDNNGDTGCTVGEAIEDYGLCPSRLDDAQAAPDSLGYLEFHIEQGPVLESLNLPVAIVDAIAGQSRLDLTFTGQSNHAGTTPMALRHDALAAAAEWIAAVEREATGELVATVGRLETQPNVRNAINGQAIASLDVRHAIDAVRLAAVERILRHAQAIADRRGLQVIHRVNLDQAAVAMHAGFTQGLADAVAATGRPVHRITSGAGHDAMIVARRMPTAMLFLRSPGGISHHPDERVRVEDVAAALEAGLEFLQKGATCLIR